MSKNILKEELNQMKYLFGYKPGRVISEQTKPAPQQSQKNMQGKGATPQDKNKELFGELLQAIKTKQPYLSSPYFPKNIIPSPSLQFVTGQNMDKGVSEQKYGKISFTVLAPTDGVVTPGFYVINFGNFNLPTELQNIDDVIKYFNEGYFDGVSPAKDELNDFSNPLSFAEQVEAYLTNVNPKQFVEFANKVNPESEKWLKDNLLKISNDVTTRYAQYTKEWARKFLESLSGQTTPQQTKPTV